MVPVLAEEPTFDVIETTSEDFDNLVRSIQENIELQNELFAKYLEDNLPNVNRFLDSIETPVRGNIYFLTPPSSVSLILS